MVGNEALVMTSLVVILVFFGEVFYSVNEAHVLTKEEDASKCLILSINIQCLKHCNELTSHCKGEWQYFAFPDAWNRWYASFSDQSSH